MTPIKLKALRQLLFFTVDEAAALVAATAERPAGVSSRAWRHWEDGLRPVPADVAQHLQHLADYRSQTIADLQTEVALAIRHARPGEVVKVAFTWHETADQWLAYSLVTPAWRPHQSALAHLAATMPEVVLQPFA